MTTEHRTHLARSLAIGAVYGDGPAVLPATYRSLGSVERAEFQAALQEYARHTDDDRRERAHILLEATR